MIWIKRIKYKKELNSYKSTINLMAQVTQGLLQDLGTFDSYIKLNDTDDLILIHSMSDFVSLINVYNSNIFSRPSTIAALKNFENTLTYFQQLQHLKTLYQNTEFKYKNTLMASRRNMCNNNEENIEADAKEIMKIEAELGRIEIDMRHVHGELIKSVSQMRVVLRYEVIQVCTEADIIKERFIKSNKNKIQITVSKVEQPEEKI